MRAIYHHHSGFSNVTFEPEKVEILGFLWSPKGAIAVIAHEGGSITTAEIHRLSYVDAAVAPNGKRGG